MKKIIPQTTDSTQQNIAKIAQLFPQVITEKEDENGNTTKAIDFELLKQHLSKDIVEGSEERYRLDWPGKKRSILKANTPITTTLKPDRESSVNFDTTENLYIEGDNFEVLKVLQESYLSKIKMIYIDPPYNTGKDFVYNDNFTQDKDEYNEEIGVIDEDGNKQYKPKPNTDTNGRFHSDWLSMMYERLLIARDLLTDDGIIFMSIDDNEVHNLRKIADEVFGEENLISQICHKARASVSNDKIISSNHNVILFYAKNQEVVFKKRKRIGLNPKLEGFDLSDKIGKYKLVPVDGPGGAKKGNPYYTFEGVTGYWRFSEKRMKDMFDKGLIVKTPKNLQQKYYLKDAKDSRRTATTWWDEKLYTSTATGRLKKMLDTNIFDTPKPVELIYKMLEMSDTDNSVILDFFSGSATTAHATMQLNAEDGGNRKFIMVQLPEKTDEKSEAYKAGYKTIPEIGKERIRRAGKKILEENAEQIKERKTPLDVGFRVYKTAESILKEVAKHPSEVSQTEMFKDEDNIKENATDEDILTAVILDFGLTLDNPIDTKKVAGSTVFMVDDNALVACFSKNIDMQVVEEMAQLQPLRAVFRDACFKDDKDLINTVESRFKQLAPNTKVHVI
ncbi:site-specific DNA-methyltransferase [Polaribacter sargassicola]|uniref:site-specific DNA-methyltransferase n=1 Tax=Polaribacter sargassicola TaxID=2836891 RepID=UPI001F1D8CA7|nr:site-specific DNA-methyltransferase [Polaribacter sp. DS7-9]MCG1037295.1 site-specific DNA-methyltransferase [Polaribacter sp. DS7-9]